MTSHLGVDIEDVDIEEKGNGRIGFCDAVDAVARNATPISASRHSLLLLLLLLMMVR